MSTNAERFTPLSNLLIATSVASILTLAITNISIDISGMDLETRASFRHTMNMLLATLSTGFVLSSVAAGAVSLSYQPRPVTFSNLLKAAACAAGLTLLMTMSLVNTSGMDAETTAAFIRTIKTLLIIPIGLIVSSVIPSAAENGVFSRQRQRAIEQPQQGTTPKPHQE